MPAPGRRWMLPLLCCLIASTLAGCHRLTATAPGADPTSTASGAGTTPAAPPVGSSASSLIVGGTTRGYRVYRPAGVSPTTPAPLVVVMHGGFGSAAQAEATYGWDAEADRYGFVVAYPDGIDRAWNVGGGCCGIPARSGVDDVAFVTDLITQLRARLDLDRQRIYATGISNGGMLAYRLACDTRLFAAIGPDSATLLGPCPAPAPVSLIHLHGTADHNIPYQGGQGQGVARIDGPAVPALVATWRRTDGCPAPATSVSGPVTTSVASCPDGRAVELITIAGAGHQWPGSPPRTEAQKLLGLDAPSTALNATDTIWQFFRAHPGVG